MESLIRIHDRADGRIPLIQSQIAPWYAGIESAIETEAMEIPDMLSSQLGRRPKAKQYKTATKWRSGPSRNGQGDGRSGAGDRF
jgi:hypothetical protein